MRMIVVMKTNNTDWPPNNRLRVIHMVVIRQANHPLHGLLAIGGTGERNERLHHRKSDRDSA